MYNSSIISCILLLLFYLKFTIASPNNVSLNIAGNGNHSNFLVIEGKYLKMPYKAYFLRPEYQISYIKYNDEVIRLLRPNEKFVGAYVYYEEDVVVYHIHKYLDMHDEVLNKNFNELIKENVQILFNCVDRLKNLSGKKSYPEYNSLRGIDIHPMDYIPFDIIPDDDPVVISSASITTISVIVSISNEIIADIINRMASTPNGARLLNPPSSYLPTSPFEPMHPLLFDIVLSDRRSPSITLSFGYRDLFVTINVDSMLRDGYQDVTVLCAKIMNFRNEGRRMSEETEDDGQARFLMNVILSGQQETAYNYEY